MASKSEVDTEFKFTHNACEYDGQKRTSTNYICMHSGKITSNKILLSAKDKRHRFSLHIQTITMYTTVRSPQSPLPLSHTVITAWSCGAQKLLTSMF